MTVFCTCQFHACSWSGAGFGLGSESVGAAALPVPATADPGGSPARAEATAQPKASPSRTRLKRRLAIRTLIIRTPFSLTSAIYFGKYNIVGLILFGLPAMASSRPALGGAGVPADERGGMHCELVHLLQRCWLSRRFPRGAPSVARIRYTHPLRANCILMSWVRPT
jgi:hypothetical protein